MTTTDIERIVATLLAERARLRRLRRDLPPQKLLLLKRLLYRLGMYQEDELIPDMETPMLTTRRFHRRLVRGGSAIQFQTGPFTLSEPRPFTGPGGEEMQEHDYLDREGTKQGVVRVHPRNEGRTLHIHWIGPENATPGDPEASNRLGANVRSISRELRRHYPEAQFLTGIRAGGFRDQPERVVREFSRERAIQYAYPTWYRGRSTRGVTYEQLNNWLGRRDERRLPRNKEISRMSNGSIEVFLHDTPVVAFHPSGEITVGHGGYNTASTAATIKEFTGLPVSKAGGTMRIRTPHGDIEIRRSHQSITHREAPLERLDEDHDFQGLMRAVGEEWKKTLGQLAPTPEEWRAQRNREMGDTTPLAALGDFLQEHGHPGGIAAVNGQYATRWWESPPSALHIGDYMRTSPHHSVQLYHEPLSDQIEGSPQIRKYRLFHVIRYSDRIPGERERGLQPGEEVRFTTPITSLENFHHLISDFPHTVKSTLIRIGEPEMRRYGVPEKESDRRISSPEQLRRRRLSRIRAFLLARRINKDIKGTQYAITKDDSNGYTTYRVVPLGSPTNNFHRAYHVYVDAEGHPMSCTCPDHYYRHRVCKHMEAVASSLAEGTLDMAEEGMRGRPENMPERTKGEGHVEQ